MNGNDGDRAAHRHIYCRAIRISQKCGSAALTFYLNIDERDERDAEKKETFQ